MNFYWIGLTGGAFVMAGNARPTFNPGEVN
jgi:hypothetical protein